MGVEAQDTQQPSTRSGQCRAPGSSHVGKPQSDRTRCVAVCLDLDIEMVGVAGDPIGMLRGDGQVAVDGLAGGL